MPAGAQVCRPHGLELLVSSSLNSSWVPAVIAYRSSASTLVLQAPDGSAGCEHGEHPHVELLEGRFIVVATCTELCL